MFFDEHACDISAGFLVGRRQGFIFWVGAFAADSTDDFIGRLRGVSAVAMMRFFFLQDLFNSLELGVVDGPAIVINFVLPFFVLIGYDFLRVSSLLDEETVVAAHVVVVALLLCEALKGVVDAQARLKLLALLLLPGELIFVSRLGLWGLGNVMRLGSVSMLLLLFLLLLCWSYLCTVLVLHLHELLNLLLVEVFTEIPLPLSDLNLQTPRPLPVLSRPFLPRSLVLLPLALTFLPRLPT